MQAGNLPGRATSRPIYDRVFHGLKSGSIGDCYTAFRQEWNSLVATEDYERGTANPVFCMDISKNGTKDSYLVINSSSMSMIVYFALWQEDREFTFKGAETKRYLPDINDALDYVMGPSASLCQRKRCLQTNCMLRRAMVANTCRSNMTPQELAGHNLVQALANVDVSTVTSETGSQSFCTAPKVLCTIPADTPKERKRELCKEWSEALWDLLRGKAADKELPQRWGQQAAPAAPPAGNNAEQPEGAAAQDNAGPAGGAAADGAQLDAAAGMGNGRDVAALAADEMAELRLMYDELFGRNQQMAVEMQQLMERNRQHESELIEKEQQYQAVLKQRKALEAQLSDVIRVQEGMEAAQAEKIARRDAETKAVNVALSEALAELQEWGQVASRHGNSGSSSEELEPACALPATAGVEAAAAVAAAAAQLQLQYKQRLEDNQQLKMQVEQLQARNRQLEQQDVAWQERLRQRESDYKEKERRHEDKVQQCSAQLQALNVQLSTAISEVLKSTDAAEGGEGAQLADELRIKLDKAEEEKACYIAELNKKNSLLAQVLADLRERDVKIAQLNTEVAQLKEPVVKQQPVARRDGSINTDSSKPRAPLATITNSPGAGKQHTGGGSPAAKMDVGTGHKDSALVEALVAQAHKAQAAAPSEQQAMLRAAGGAGGDGSNNLPRSPLAAVTSGTQAGRQHARGGSPVAKEDAAVAPSDAAAAAAAEPLAAAAAPADAAGAGRLLSSPPGMGSPKGDAASSPVLNLCKGGASSSAAPAGDITFAVPLQQHAAGKQGTASPKLLLGAGLKVPPLVLANAAAWDADTAADAEDGFVTPRAAALDGSTTPRTQHVPRTPIRQTPRSNLRQDELIIDVRSIEDVFATMLGGVSGGQGAAGAGAGTGGICWVMGCAGGM